MKDKVIEIVAEQLNCSINECTLNARLIDLGCDSLDQIELIMDLEDEFGFETVFDGFSNTGIVTVLDLVDYVNEMVNEVEKGEL